MPERDQPVLKIAIGNSYSQITDVPTALAKELRDLLSYEVDPQAAYFGGYSNKVKRLIDKKGYFPTGLLQRVKDWALDKGETLDITDTRMVPPLSPLGTVGSVKPYDWQIDATTAAIQARRGIISAPTGAGKAHVIAMICNAFGLKTLIVVPSLELKTQLTETLRQAFGDHLVGPLRPTKRPYHLITVENVDALDPKIPMDGVGLLIIDEFHKSASATYQKLNALAWIGIYYRIGLSATPYRTQDTETILLESIISDVIYELSYQDAKYAGLIVPVEAYYIDLPRTKPTKPLPDKWSVVYKALVTDNAFRNTYIVDILRSLHVQGMSALCLVKEIKHGTNLQLLSGFQFPLAKGDNAPGLNSEFIKHFNDQSLPVLIGTGVLGEGIDTRPAEYVIIAGLGKSKGQFLQQVGRGLRKFPGKVSCKVIIFRDPNHKWMLSHYNAQAKILREYYGCSVTKLNLENT